MATSPGTLTPSPAATPAWFTAGVASIVVAGLLLAARESYLLFHALAEVFSVVVAFSVFAIAWSSRRYIKNGYLVLVGIAYLFLGFLDILHTLSYQGMAIFPGHPFAANQLWIAARGMESVTLVAAFAFLGSRRLPRPEWLLAGYAFLTAALVASIFWWEVFPVCFVAGQGQTTFKIVAEYVIIALLGLSAVLLRKYRARFEPDVYRALLGSLLTAMGCEFAFTLYVSNYGSMNLAGHLLKIASYYLVHRAILETGVRRPYDLVFRELSLANDRLRLEVTARTEAEERQAKLVGELRTALDEIKTLRGVIPICSHCKRIRNDAGSWDRLEAYLSEHSDAQFSHGICPECMDRHYGDL